MKWFGAAWLALALPIAAAAQGTLEDAARQARAAWLAHDAQALVGQSPSLVLQIPGADPSSALGKAQAVELLRRYFLTATEQDVTITKVEASGGDRGLVELERRYAVRGTTDVRRETVFLGFRRVGGVWGLSELRSTS